MSEVKFTEVSYALRWLGLDVSEGLDHVREVLFSPGRVTLVKLSLDDDGRPFVVDDEFAVNTTTYKIVDDR